MSTSQFDRFSWLSEQILFNNASKNELDEFNQLLSVWEDDKELNICNAISEL